MGSQASSDGRRIVKTGSATPACQTQVRRTVHATAVTHARPGS